MPPIFDFKCPKCGTITEKMEPSWKTHISCPSCGYAAERIISGKRAFRFYGVGFRKRSHKDTGDFA